MRYVFVVRYSLLGLFLVGLWLGCCFAGYYSGASGSCSVLVCCCVYVG